MNPTLVDAIRTRCRLRLVHNGTPRLAEPRWHGLGTKGPALLRVHQLSGGSQSEPLFDIAKIESLEVPEEAFDRPGPDCRKDDSVIETIACRW